ncbi:MAG: hypothetical protein ACYSUK_12930, partial [Planctomycetota bacterium]
TDAQTGAFSRLEGKLKLTRKAYNDVAVSEGKTSEQAIKLRKEIKKLEKQLDVTGKSAGSAGKRIGGIRTQIRGLGPAAAGIASSFLIFSELPQALADINSGRVLSSFLRNKGL